MKTLRETVDERIVDYLEHNRECVHVEPLQGMFNFRCYENSVQFALDNKDAEVIMGIYVDEGTPLLHYWIKEGENYYDVTLGYRAQWCDYYPIRKIWPSEYRHIGISFNKGLAYYKKKFVKWYERPFIGRIL